MASSCVREQLDVEHLTSRLDRIRAGPGRDERTCPAVAAPRTLAELGRHVAIEVVELDVRTAADRALDSGDGRGDSVG